MTKSEVELREELDKILNPFLRLDLTVTWTQAIKDLETAREEIIALFPDREQIAQGILEIGGFCENERCADTGHSYSACSVGALAEAAAFVRGKK